MGSPILGFGKRKRTISKIFGYTDDICDLLKTTLDSSVLRYDLGRVNSATARKIFELTQVDVSFFSHEVDSYALRHAFKKHKNDKPPLTLNDFKKISKIVTNYDTISIGWITKEGNKSVVYTKKFDDGIIFYIEELRTKHGTLSLKTMYKTKTPPTASHAASNVEPYVCE